MITDTLRLPENDTVTYYGIINLAEGTIVQYREIDFLGQKLEDSGFEDDEGEDEVTLPAD